MGIRREPLDKLLIRHGADEGKLADARTHADRAGISLLGGVTRTKAVDDGALASVLGELTGLDVLNDVDVEDIDIDAEFARCFEAGGGSEQHVG